MRLHSTLLALSALLGSGAVAGAQCLPGEGVDFGCGAPALHISSSVENGPPLIWSPEFGTLVPPPPDAIFRGRTVPTGEIVGRRVAPVGELPQPLTYNHPGRFAGDTSSRVVLVPLLRPIRPVKVRGEYP